MNSMNTTITIPATMSKGRTKYEHANTVYGEQRWEWGVPQRNYLLSVYTQVETAETYCLSIRKLRQPRVSMSSFGMPIVAK